MAPTVSTSRIKLLPRQRRSAATDTTTSSSGVTSVVTSTAGTRPLAVKVADTGEAAGEKTTKRISRQNLHRRLRRLGRKLDDVRVMFNAVANAACIDDNRASKRHQRGSRAGRNARRRLRGQDGRFVATSRPEGVKDLHPSPKHNLATKPEDQEERQVAVVVKTKKTKKQRRRQRGEWPVGSQEANRREEKEARRVEQKLAQAEAQWKATEQRAIAAEADADGLRAQLQEQEAAIRSAQEAATQRKRAIAAEAEVAELQGQLQQTQEQVKATELELQAQARAAEAQAAQAAQLKDQLQAQESLVRSAQETVAHHQDEVEWRTVRIAELAEKVETATSALERERDSRRADAHDTQQLQEDSAFVVSGMAVIQKEIEKCKRSGMVNAYGRHS